jgi:hypothetical protein
MSTTINPPSAVDPGARLRRAALIRAIGRRRPGSERLHFVCGPCEASWSGSEHACWNCAMPAATEYTHRGSALQLLLQPVCTSRVRRGRR